MSVFTKRLKNLRKQKSLTQQELADLLGVNRVTYTNWENGNREPNFLMLGMIANELESSFDYLMGRADDNNFEKNPTTQEEFENLSEIERRIVTYRQALQYLGYFKDFLDYAGLDEELSDTEIEIEKELIVEVKDKHQLIVKQLEKRLKNLEKNKK
ncbi:XRE family transcriptional regulator [Lactococcus lactis subsp. lactis]|uniref:helix-turn-helix domain-containing protein n=1 Tax=Lactococcus lactis TaxID=1358 RepID=UPI00223BC131|nr:helix-turn-helix transcriptional regulator [Lactococcus lactis]MCT0016886.1 XRE family transcriptional regulator [Lactococcus lactis subsp. lactis]